MPSPFVVSEPAAGHAPAARCIRLEASSPGGLLVGMEANR